MNMKHLFILCSCVSCIVGSAHAKRVAPEEVASITAKGVVYSIAHYGFQNGADQNGGVILAHDLNTKKLLWRVQVYKPTHEPDGKSEQDVFITSLSYDKYNNILILADEKSRIFVLDLATKKVTQVR